MWGSEGKEARAAVGVTKGVRGGEHQRKHIRIMDPPPLCLLSLSLSLSRLTGFLFILPRNSRTPPLFRNYTDLNPRRAVLREGGETYPPVVIPSTPPPPRRCATFSNSPVFIHTQLRSSTCIKPKSRPRTSGSFMKPCWFFEVFENNQLEPACSFFFLFFFSQGIGIGGSFIWKYFENRNQPMIFFQSSKNRPTTG